MVFQNDILAGSSGGSSASSVYKIDQSIRFNKNDSAYMLRTPSSAGSGTAWTISFWFKLGETTPTDIRAFLAVDGATNSANRFRIGINDSSLSGVGSDGQLFVTAHGTSLMYTNRVFRDPSAWTHVVYTWDSANAVASERQRLYINGVRETSFQTSTNPTASQVIGWNTANRTSIGASYGVSSGTVIFYADSYMAEIHNLDGYSYDPSYFGLFNENGIWIPKEYSGSYGSNGFKIDGRDSADLADDESGNGNDFTTSGLASHDQVADSPTNNFAIYNVLDNYVQGATFSNGNLERTRSASNRSATMSNLGMNSGKWYCEIYIASHFQATTMLGVQGYRTDAEPEWSGNGVTNQGVGYYMSNGQKYINGSGSAYGNTYAVGDIIGIALDLDNEFVYFSKNGTFQDSGDPTSGASGTGGIDIVTSPANTETGYWFFAVGDGSGNIGSRSSIINFGQEGTFAGNVTAGGNSDSNGIGNFKYSVPSGYLALCTKNLGS